MRVFVIGATGVLGRNVIPRLLERGHTVQAVVRRAEQAARLARLGVDAAIGDILDADSLTRPLRGCDAALHLATAIPAATPTDLAAWARNDAIRRDGTRYLLAAVAAAGVRRYVQQSITFLYGDQGTAVVDESTPIQPVGRIQAAADMEAVVRASTPIEWCILRGGALYGPTTHVEERWADGMRSGALRLPGDGSAIVSLIHEADFARAIVLAVESAPPGSTFNVVDDQPVTYRELYAHIAALQGAETPAGGDPEVRSLACSNVRIKAALGWEPLYATYRSGIVG
jgi:nucleoside-diphosphate-sugar epimerase